MAIQFLFDRCLDTFDAVMMIRSVALGAPVLTKSNELDFTDYGITAGANTGDGNIYIRPEPAAAVDDYRANCTVAGGNATRAVITPGSMTFTAAGRTIDITGDWTATYGVVAGDFLQFSGTASNDKFGHCYRVLTVTNNVGTNDRVTLETTEAIVDETMTTTPRRVHSGGVFEIIEDRGGLHTVLGHMTVGRGAPFHDDDLRIHIANHTVNWAVSDTLDWTLEANDLDAGGDAQGWTDNDTTISTPDGNGNYAVETYLEGVGISELETINVNFLTQFNFASEIYTFSLRTADGYVGSSDYDQQPNTSPALYVSGDDADLDVWVSVSGDRIAGCIEAQSGNFQHYYGGFGDPLADNNQYERPLLTGGNNITSDIPDDSDPHNSAYWAPRTDESATIDRFDPSSLVVRWVDGQWFYVHSLDFSGFPVGQADLYLTPRGYDETYTSTQTDGNEGALRREGEFSYRMRPAIGTSGDEYFIIPQVIVMRQPDDNVLLELQGVFFITGFGAVLSRDTITIDGNDYAIFNNTNDAGQGDFVALQLTGL